MTGAVRAVRAEWVKFGSLPSNTVTAVLASATIVALAGLLVTVRTSEGKSPTPTELLSGVSWAQFVLVVLAVVTVCSEWSSGTSRTTFLAVPNRWPVLAGKVTVVGAVGLVAGVVGGVGALAVASAAGVDLGTEPPLTARLIAGAGLYLGTLAVLALGIATIVRDLAGSVLTVAGFLWVMPFVAALVPAAEVRELAPYLPASAGVLLVAPESADAVLTPWGGYAVLLGWTASALAGAVVTLRTRDV